MVDAVHGHGTHGGERRAAQEAGCHSQAERLARVSLLVSASSCKVCPPAGPIARGPVAVALPSVRVDTSHRGPGSVPARVLLGAVRVGLEGVTARGLGIDEPATSYTGPAATDRAGARAGPGGSPLLFGVTRRGFSIAAATPAEPPASGRR